MTTDEVIALPGTDFIPGMPLYMKGTWYVKTAHNSSINSTRASYLPVSFPRSDSAILIILRPGRRGAAAGVPDDTAAVAADTRAHIPPHGARRKYIPPHGARRKWATAVHAMTNNNSYS